MNNMVLREGEGRQGEEGAGGQHLQVGMRHDELAHHAVIGKAVQALADRQHENSRRGVKTVSSHQQAGSGLAHIDDTILHHLLGVVHVLHRAVLTGGINAEDAAD